MFALERINIIKNYLREHRKLDVHSLSDMFKVSEVTIRRDLEKLESEGFLTRIHGGAILATEDEPGNDRNEGEGDSSEREDREEIARMALHLIGDGDVIMLMDGTIGARIAKGLAERSNVTVLTNDLAIALEVAGQSRNKVVLLGGTPDPASGAVFGSLAEANIRKFYVGKLFFEVDGIDERLEPTVSSQEKADLILEAAACASDKTMLCTPARFSKNAFYRLGPISFADRIITSARIPDSFKARVFANDIKLFTSIDAFEGGQ